MYLFERNYTVHQNFQESSQVWKELLKKAGLILMTRLTEDRDRRKTKELSAIG